MRASVGNGVDGESGGYSVPPLDASRLVASLFTHGFGTIPPARAPLPDIDPNDLSATGWGVVFTEGCSPAVREALAPLLERRREQANQGRVERYRELTYFPGESKNDFLVRQGVGPGPVMPDRLPYYLLLVGDPDQLPFAVQDELEAQYAVGRLDLEAPEDFGRYAEAVVAVESRGVRSAGLPHVTVFAPANPETAPRSSAVDTWLNPWPPSSARVPRSIGCSRTTPTRKGSPTGCGPARPISCSSPATGWASGLVTAGSVLDRVPSCARTGRGPKWRRDRSPPITILPVPTSIPPPTSRGSSPVSSPATAREHPRNVAFHAPVSRVDAWRRLPLSATCRVACCPIREAQPMR